MIRQRQRKSGDGEKDSIVVKDKQMSVVGSASNPKEPACLRRTVAIILVLAVVLVIVYLSVPLVFRYCPAIRRSLLFMNYVNLQPLHNLSRPQLDYGLNCTKPFFINYGDIKLGAWHVFPGSFNQQCTNDTQYDDFSDGRPVFLYLHGNGGTRGGNHRLGLYKVLAYSSLDAHVIAIDYRGYGDSSPLSPTAPGVIADASAAYLWLLKRVNRSRLHVWGHSLGTAVAVHFLASVPKEDCPRRLILEAPFTTTGDATYHYPLAKLIRWLPYFNSSIVEPIMACPETRFDSEHLIKNVSCPIMILHAEDDRIIPLHIGIKLYQKALASTPIDSIKPEMVILKGNLHYGHKNIYQHEELASIVANFCKIK